MEPAVSLLRDLSHVPVTLGAPLSCAVRVRGADGQALYSASLRLAVERLG